MPRLNLLDVLLSFSSAPARAARSVAVVGIVVCCSTAAAVAQFPGSSGSDVEAETPILEPFVPLLDTTRAAVPEILWRVENSFRFFDDPADTEMHRSVWLNLPDAARATAPILAAERTLSARHRDGWAADVFRNTCWDSSRNQHVCGGKKNYIDPKSHAAIFTSQNIPDAATVTCQWRMTPLRRRGPGGAAKTAPCDQPVVFDIPYPTGAAVSFAIGGRDVAATDVAIKDLLIVGMGDSFASGEGNPDIPVRFSPERAADYGAIQDKFNLAGYPARVGSWRSIGDLGFVKNNAQWLDQACHRSLYSHQLRSALQLAIEDPRRAVTFVGLSCSGAEVSQGLFLRYKGHEWTETPPAYSQISAAAKEQCGSKLAPALDFPEAYHMRGRLPELQNLLVLNKCDRRDARKIDLLFVSIGGNDIGFAKLIANAVLDDTSLLRRIGGWFGSVHDQLQARAAMTLLDARYKTLNRAIHNILHVPWSESDRIILTAYPVMALLGDGSKVCPDGRAGMEVVDAYALSNQRTRDAVAIADVLDEKMQKSARAHGWSYAARHRNQFIGRGLCAGYSENALSVADDLRIPRKIDGTWTPYNPADYRAYAVRQRWFRTPNDAYMTGNFHMAASSIPKVIRDAPRFGLVQLLLASIYSGAFHPTAEGHAAIADALTDTARNVLRTYGQATPAAGPFER